MAEIVTAATFFCRRRFSCRLTLLRLLRQSNDRDEKFGSSGVAVHLHADQNLSATKERARSATDISKGGADETYKAMDRSLIANAFRAVGLP